MVDLRLRKKQRLAAEFGAWPIHSEPKQSPGGEAGAFKKLTITRNPGIKVP
jgi:hypothetical protein